MGVWLFLLFSRQGPSKIIGSSKPFCPKHCKLNGFPKQSELLFISACSLMCFVLHSIRIMSTSPQEKSHSLLVKWKFCVVILWKNLWKMIRTAVWQHTHVYCRSGFMIALSFICIRKTRMRGYADGAGQNSVISPIYVNKGQKDKCKVKEQSSSNKTQNLRYCLIYTAQYFLILTLLFTRNFIWHFITFVMVPCEVRPY